MTAETTNATRPAGAGPANASPIDLIGFNLKMLASNRRGMGRGRSALVSAGTPEDKAALLPECRALSEAGVTLYCTPGTRRYFAAQGLETTLAHKVSDDAEPNIRTLLETGGIDFVVNILTGERDYDENSDARVIRSLAVRGGLPLVTDRDVAIETIRHVLADVRAGTFDYAIRSDERPWDLRGHFLKLVQERGGFANHHGHFDKAYLISPENLALGFADMEKKWELYRHLKANYTMEDLIERIGRALETVIAQGASYCRTMVDADSIVGTLPIEAAHEVRRRYADRITFEIGVQPLEGVLDEASREAYVAACEMADFCGGLPSRDRPREEAHLDVVMRTAKRLGKPVEVHVDQENNPYQHETELLALKTIEHGMQGRVYAIHAIFSAKEAGEQRRIADLCARADMGVVICPSAALSMKPLPMQAPLHNSIAPFPLLQEAGVRCYLGIDNINDLFMPIVDGDMWTEARLLMEATRHYDLETVADWATRPPLHLTNEAARRRGA